MKIADNIIGKILGKPRARGGKNDWDGDGVLNRKDCQPRNTMRQDAIKGECTVCGKIGKTRIHGVYLHDYGVRKYKRVPMCESCIKAEEKGVL